MKFLKLISFSLLLVLFLFPLQPITTANAATKSATHPIEVIIPTVFTLEIGEQLNLMDSCFLSGMLQFKSSKSSVATVDEFGTVTAQKTGEATITASWLSNHIKIKVKVRKTTISLNNNHITLNAASTYQLLAKTSTPAKVSYKSKKKTIASVDEYGVITANKPGETTITVSANGTKASCKVTVLAPTITLNQTKVSMYKNHTFTLTALTSNGVAPTFTSSSSKIATVSADGVVTAKRHGTAIITATVNGVSVKCSVTVLKPVITLSKTTLSLTVGDTQTLTAYVSSGNQPTFQSSNSKIVKVTPSGQLTAKKAGTVYITVSEDGSKTKCKVTVTKATVTS